MKRSLEWLLFLLCLVSRSVRAEGARLLDSIAERSRAGLHSSSGGTHHHVESVGAKDSALLMWCTLDSVEGKYSLDLTKHTTVNNSV